MAESQYQLSRDTHVWSFNAQAQPTITVDSGSIIDIETWDCFTGQVTSEADTVASLDLTRVNSATGPIAVNGAEPGDTLAVTLLDIQPGPIGAGMIIPEWGQLIDQVTAPPDAYFPGQGRRHHDERPRAVPYPTHVRCHRCCTRIR